MPFVLVHHIRKAASGIAAITVDPDSINDMEGRALLGELVDAVTRLTRTEREARVERLIAGSFRAARRGRAARRD